MGSKVQRVRNFKFSFFIMRKYLRLTLVLTAFICCALMLVYQQRYSRLNVIFQMMNSFGNKLSDANCGKKLLELSKNTKPDWTLSEALSGGSAWTEVFPHIHMYSTFLLKNETHTFAFVDDGPMTDVEKLTCAVLFNNEAKPYLGEIKVQLFQKNKMSLFVMVKCQLPAGISGKPYGIMFSYSNTSSKVSLPVISKVSPVSMFSMCVEPLSLGFDNVYRTIEFLAYHHHLGVNHFIFYDRGISSRVRKLLLELSPKSSIFITLLPWNVPFKLSSASRYDNEYFVDCVHRVVSQNYSSFILKSDIDRFIVLKDKRTLYTLVTDEQLAINPPRLYEQKFCTEYMDDTIARHLNISFVILLKNKVMQMGSSLFSMIYSVDKLRKQMYQSDFNVLLFKGFPQLSSALPKHIAVVNVYKNCNDSHDVLEENFIVDKYMWRFKNLLYKSRLYNLAKQSDLIIDN